MSVQISEVKLNGRVDEEGEEFEIDEDGSLSVEAVDEEFMLTMTSEDDPLILLYYENPQRQGFRSRRLLRTSDGRFVGLAPGKHYFVVAITEAELDKRVQKEAAKSARMAARRSVSANVKVKDVKFDAEVGAKEQEQTMESCSCIEGVPCTSAYNCLDWENRFEIARKNGYTF